MTSSFGTIGYKMGCKKVYTIVENDAELLWQMCVREIYVLMRHYGSCQEMKNAFEQVIVVNENQKPPADFSQMFMDLTRPFNQHNTDNWNCLLKWCQHSFINILEAGYVLNNGDPLMSYIFILDLNKGIIEYCDGDSNYTTEITIDEIMEFCDDMPTKSLTDILSNMRERFDNYSQEYMKIKTELDAIQCIIHKAQILNDNNIIQKAEQMKDNINYAKTKLDATYRFMYHRMDLLNLIEHEGENENDIKVCCIDANAMENELISYNEAEADDGEDILDDDANDDTNE